MENWAKKSAKNLISDLFVSLDELKNKIPVEKIETKETHMKLNLS